MGETAKKIIQDALSSPKRVETAEGRVEEHSLKDILAAVKELEQAEAAECTQKAPWGMSLARTVPTGDFG